MTTKPLQKYKISIKLLYVQNRIDENNMALKRLINTNVVLILLGDEILVVIGEANVVFGGGLRGAAEHVLAVAHTTLR